MFKSGRGGSRPNSGRPTKFKLNSDTQIRIPGEYVEIVNQFINALDQGKVHFPTGDLTPLPVRRVYKMRGEAVVKVSDLEDQGYEIVESRQSPPPG